MTDDVVEFTIEHGTKTQSTANARSRVQEAPGSSEREQEDRSGFPDWIRRKYYIVAGKAGLEGEVNHARVYTDRQGDYLAFKDMGNRLSTRNTAPGVVRDMLAIAEHRGWRTVSVRGSVEFKREAWLEAAARGLTVRGYQPAELDNEALRKRLADRSLQTREATRPVPDLAASPVMNAAAPSRLQDLEAGVTGHHVDLGRAPYPGRERAEPSAYVDLALADGGSGRVWGAALPEAVEAAKVGVGDGVRIRRDGTERLTRDVASIDGPPGAMSVQRRDVTRNRWTVAAERFRSLDRREAVRDPAVAAAHSHIAVLERALKTRFSHDQRARQIMMNAARDRIVEHLEKGRTFRRAEVRAAERVTGKEAFEPASRGSIRRIEHLRARERGRDR